MELDSILKIRAVEAETGEDIVGATCNVTDLVSGKRLTATTAATPVTPEQQEQETAFKRFAIEDQKTKDLRRKSQSRNKLNPGLEEPSSALLRVLCPGEYQIRVSKVTHHTVFRPTTAGSTDANPFQHRRVSQLVFRI